MGYNMFNMITNHLMLVKTNTIAIGRVLEGSSWLIILFLIVFVILVVITLNLFISNKVEKTKLTKSQEEKEILSTNYTDLDKSYKDTVNMNTKLVNQNDELSEENEKLKKLAYADNLTSLPNRLPFKELLDSVMLTLRDGETIGLSLISLDNFKFINSQLGASYGDELLIDVTHRLKQVVDDNDYLARIGGDEFVILTQNISDYAEFEDKLRRIFNVFSYPFSLSTEERFVSVSVGVAVAPKDGDNSSTLLKNANVAMRNAKARGKNRVVYFDESMNEAITKKIQIQSELRKAFEDSEFEIYYEPVISFDDYKIKGIEALIYWNHPTRGILREEEYISYAEETGLIIPVGLWAFKSTCAKLKELQDSGFKDIKLCYNVTELFFKDPEFISIIWDIVSKSQINPNSLILEITETTALDDVENTISTIEKLGELEIKFGLDKFGTNYNSIRYLDELDLSYIKLSKRLSMSADESIDKQRLVEEIINLIKIFDFSVIAGGVKSKSQEGFLKHVDCDMAQGPLYSEAVPGDEIIKLIKEGYIKNT